jgi:hypothetical protein
VVSVFGASGDNTNGIAKEVEPSPTTATECNEMIEAASLAALSAPANIRAARAAIIVFFMEYNLLIPISAL